MDHRQEFKIFCGNGNPSLAAEITRFLHCKMGKAEVSKFANGETSVVIQESIRAQDVYIVQSICSNLNQINFIKHAKNNSNSSLNTSIRSPSATLIKAPSFSSLSLQRSASTLRANIVPPSSSSSTSGPSEPALSINNSLLDHVKNLGDNNSAFFSPELNPSRLIPKEDFDTKHAPSSLSAKAKSKSTPTSPRNPTTSFSPPSTPIQPTTTTTTTSNTPKSVQPLSLPSTPMQPTTGSSTTPNITPTPSPRGVTFSKSKSTPGSPIPVERVVISHSTTKDSDMYNWSANDALMELLIMGDAFKRASCNKLVAVIPFYGYARQSKKHKSRAPISAKLVANMLQTAGFDRVITIDMHASQIQGFFDIPVDNLYAEASIVKYIKKRISGDKIVVAPGVGGVKRAKSVADKINTELAILHKIGEHNDNKSLVLVGDVKDKVALIIDDIADTCDTLEQATYTLIERGALKVYALVSHGVLSGPAIERINAMPLTELIITNSIQNDYNLSQSSKIKVINLGPLLGEAIRRTNFGESLSTYFFN